VYIGLSVLKGTGHLGLLSGSAPQTTMCPCLHLKPNKQ